MDIDGQNINAGGAAVPFLPVQREPRIVESETHEGQKEIELLVDLRHRVSDVGLEVTVAVVPALVEERIHLLVPQLAETVGRHNVGGLLIFTVLQGLGRYPGIERI